LIEQEAHSEVYVTAPPPRSAVRSSENICEVSKNKTYFIQNKEVKLFENIHHLQLKLEFHLTFHDFIFITYEPAVKYVVNTFILFTVSEDATIYVTLIHIDRGQPDP
jgi:hypothetical protein